MPGTQCPVPGARRPVPGYPGDQFPSACNRVQAGREKKASRHSSKRHQRQVKTADTSLTTSGIQKLLTCGKVLPGQLPDDLFTSMLTSGLLKWDGGAGAFVTTTYNKAPAHSGSSESDSDASRHTRGRKHQTASPTLVASQRVDIANSDSESELDDVVSLCPREGETIGHEVTFAQNPGTRHKNRGDFSSVSGSHLSSEEEPEDDTEWNFDRAIAEVFRVLPESMCPVQHADMKVHIRSSIEKLSMAETIKAV